jgi:hypothetical protein
VLELLSGFVVELRNTGLPVTKAVLASDPRVPKEVNDSLLPLDEVVARASAQCRETEL